jgi:hypothetical protein
LKNNGKWVIKWLEKWVMLVNEKLFCKCGIIDFPGGYQILI